MRGKQVNLMNCPGCQTPINEVKTESHYGVHVILDQCPRCGGIWFDRWELLHVKQGEAAKIESAVNADLLTRETVLEKSTLLCPRDNKVLEIFKDSLFPKELIVEHCKSCGGFWFNRGQFKAYQDHRSKKEAEIKDEKYDKLRKEINALLAAKSNSQKYQVMADLGEFLSSRTTPVSMQGLGGPYRDQTNPTVEIILSVIRILLSLFLKKR